MDAWLERIAELVGNAAPAPSQHPHEPSHGCQPSREHEQPRDPAPPLPPPARNQEGCAAPPPPPPPPPAMSHDASSPHDFCIISRAPKDARVTLERWRACVDRALQQVVNAGNANHPPPAVTANSSIYDGSCLAFTTKLRRVTWPHKFHPELPSRYDGSSNLEEFLQLYTIGIQAAGGNDKGMAN